MSKTELRIVDWNDKQEGVEALMKHFNMNEYHANMVMAAHLSPDRDAIMKKIDICNKLKKEEDRAGIKSTDPKSFLDALENTNVDNTSISVDNNTGPKKIYKR